MLLLNFGVIARLCLFRIGYQTSSLFRTAVSQIGFCFYRRCSGLHREKAGAKMTSAVWKRNVYVGNQVKNAMDSLMTGSGLWHSKAIKLTMPFIFHSYIILFSFLS